MTRLALFAAFGALMAALMLSGGAADVTPPVAPSSPSLLLPIETPDVFIPCLPVENMLKINGCPMAIL